MLDLHSCDAVVTMHACGSDASTDWSVVQLCLLPGLRHCVKVVRIISLQFCEALPDWRMKRRMRENQPHHQEMTARDTLSRCSLILLYVECDMVHRDDKVLFIYLFISCCFFSEGNYLIFFPGREIHPSLKIAVWASPLFVSVRERGCPTNHRHTPTTAHIHPHPHTHTATYTFTAESICLDAVREAAGSSSPSSFCSSCFLSVLLTVLLTVVAKRVSKCLLKYRIFLYLKIKWCVLNQYGMRFVF